MAAWKSKGGGGGGGGYEWLHRRARGYIGLTASPLPTQTSLAAHSSVQKENTSTNHS